jgi:hypothetical protein
MSIHNIPKKINPIVNIKDKVLIQAKNHWYNKVDPTISHLKAYFDLREDVFIIIAIIFIGLAGFGLGKLSAHEKERSEVQITASVFTDSSTKRISSSTTSNQNKFATTLIDKESDKGLLVASKTGKKYHFPWCPGAQQIADKNKIWFATYSEAQKAGYTPASNCPNLK